MRACVMRQGRLVVDDTDDPRPETGQMLVRILACGICGSDLHFLRHGETMVEMTDAMLPSMGAHGHGDGAHRPVARHHHGPRVLRRGRRARAPTPRARRPGTRVVSVPVLFSSTGLHQLAYNNAYPGGLRAVHGPVRAARPRSPQRARLPARRAHRAAGRGHPRRGRARGPRRATARWWWDAGRSGWPSSPGCGPSAWSRSWLPTCPRPVGRWRSPWGRSRPSTPPRRVSSTPGVGVDGRRPLVAFEAVGVPGMLQQLLPRPPARHPGRGRRGVHGARPHPSLLRHRQGAVVALRPGLRRRRVRRRAAGPGRRRHRRFVHDHRAPWTSTACPAPSRRWPTPTSTSRSSWSPRRRDARRRRGARGFGAPGRG